jgi:hypothetical protein
MRMKTVLSGIVGLFCAAWVSNSSATDIVSFNAPGQWVTQRTDAIVAKVQLDTSKIPQKKIEFSLSKVEDGKKKLIATKTFKVTDYTQEYALGSAGSPLCGGKDFLRIDWSIPGTKDKGMLFPVGVVNLDKIPKIEPIHAVKVKDAIDAKNWASLIGGVKYSTVKGNDFGLLWTPKSLVIVCKKMQTKDIVRFAFDGKNGKNAFMSHPDRTIDMYQSKDSLGTLFYERAFVNDTLAYNQMTWRNDIAMVGDKQTAVIVVPWYDLGMLPLDGRSFGFAAFDIDDKAKALAAVPEKARYFVPGSWGTVVLDK